MRLRRTTLLVTISLWIVLVVALGYWRIFYEWRWGALAISLLNTCPYWLWSWPAFYRVS
jgi:hypothetical protein